MCGIMGYIGNRSAKNIVYTGLTKLEYRGYDSAGIATIEKSRISVAKAVGVTANLALDTLPDAATIAIGHTRWATHGKPTKHNAHPHTVGKITLVHNGIIENYQQLAQSYDITDLKSDTDSEVLAAVIDAIYKKTKDILTATQEALQQIEGTFGIVVIASDNPDQVITARRGSPIVIGVGDQQYYIASDTVAITDHTDKVVYLEDDQIAVITARTLDIYNSKLLHHTPAVQQLEKQKSSQGKQHYGSYLEKEIHEQPLSIENVLRGHVTQDGTFRLGGPNLTDNDIAQIKRILIIGCGTSYYAGMYAKYQLEELLNIPISVEYASEFRYRHGAYDPEGTLAIFMSQSGETADTLASLREAKRRRIPCLGIVNTVGSSIAREVTVGGIYLHAGTEVSVASTKAYSSMVVALLMLGGYFAYKRGTNAAIIRSLAHELLALPDEIRATLKLQPQINKIAAKLSAHDWYYLGRSALYPVALEGALKLTEVSYIHAQAFPTGEMKHGPIALIDKSHLSVLLMPEDPLLYQKSASTLQEIKARNGQTLTISTRPKDDLSDHHITIAHAGNYTDGLIYNICLQLLALSMAQQKKVNIDQPRNLAKSVTVE